MQSSFHRCKPSFKIPSLMAPPGRWQTSVALLAFTLTLASGQAISFHDVIVPCSSGSGNANSTFQCLSDGKCILERFKCDGVKHCADNSDENQCGQEVCDGKLYFSCKYKLCYFTWLLNEQPNVLFNLAINHLRIRSPRVLSTFLNRELFLQVIVISSIYY